MEGGGGGYSRRLQARILDFCISGTNTLPLLSSDNWKENEDRGGRKEEQGKEGRGKRGR